MVDNALAPVQQMGAVAGFEDVGAVEIDEREVGAVAATAREEAEIKAAIVLARRFPRDENAAYTRIIKACKRPSLCRGGHVQLPAGQPDRDRPERAACPGDCPLLGQHPLRPAGGLNGRPDGAYSGLRLRRRDQRLC